YFFFFQAEDGIRDFHVTGVQTCALPISYFKAVIQTIDEKKPGSKNREYNATIDAIKDLALKIVEINPALPSEASMAINNIESSSFLINFVSSNLNLTVQEKQSLLEINSL